jgi:hypothetical protein
MRIRLIAPATAILVAGVIGTTALPAVAAPAPAPAATAAAAAPVTVPLTGTASDGSQFVGTFSPTNFSNRGGQLNVTGLVSGTLTSTADVATPVSQRVTSAVDLAQVTGSCTILDLTLGPLHLDLLGLVVDLNPVHLVITAQQGPGNLLGNLLCAIAGLLDGTGGTGGLTGLLNQLLGLLRGV